MFIKTSTMVSEKSSYEEINNCCVTLIYKQVQLIIE